ncbi:putative Iron uptake protein [uncultured Thiomicrorhabdus sp.]
MHSLFIGLLLTASMSAFAFCMQSHCKALYQSKTLPGYAPNIKKFAYALLLASLLMSLMIWSIGMALITWTALLTLAGALVSVLLTYQPLWLHKIMPASLLLSVLLVFTLGV